MGTPVCIAGMHRSGTSLTAMVLQRAGLYLGPERRLMPSTPDNPLGYWENLGFVALNDRILAHAGGSWNCPPSGPVAPGNFADDPMLVMRARIALLRLARGAVWGWKDPRNSLTLPFWLARLRDLKVVICLRHPREVERSMQARLHTARGDGLALWITYNQRLLDAAPPRQRIIVHHAELLRRPLATVSRVLEFIGLPPECADPVAVTQLVRPELARHACPADAALPAGVAALYSAMCDEAATR